LTVSTSASVTHGSGTVTLQAGFNEFNLEATGTFKTLVVSSGVLTILSGAKVSASDATFSGSLSVSDNGSSWKTTGGTTAVSALVKSQSGGQITFGTTTGSGSAQFRTAGGGTIEVG
jgi:hypothetical protein